MAHDDTIEALYYANLYAFPANLTQNKEKKWYKKKKRAKSWIIA